MDEGFTTFISTLATNEILEENKEFPLQNSYYGYTDLHCLVEKCPKARMQTDTIIIMPMKAQPTAKGLSF